MTRRRATPGCPSTCLRRIGSAGMAVEVERKFVCESDIPDKLDSIGAVCTGQYEFKDRYYDSPSYSLTLKDFWLRRRDRSWELKCPASSRTKMEKTDEALCTKYREVTDLSQVQDEVKKVLKACKEAAEDSPGQECTKAYAEDESWLKDLNLVCFAEFKTLRCSYVLEDKEGEGTVRVDLDQADFGYCVGEIEVLVAEENDIKSAEQRIQKTAEKLGLGDEKNIQGKMDVYLQRYCPDHYAKLVNAHVL